MRTLIYVIIIFSHLSSFSQEKFVLESYSLSLDSNKSVTSVIMNIRVFYNTDTTIVTYLNKKEWTEYKKNHTLNTKNRFLDYFLFFKIISGTNDTIINEGHQIVTKSLSKLKKIKIKVPKSQGILFTYEISSKSNNLVNKRTRERVYEVVASQLIVLTSKQNEFYEKSNTLFKIGLCNFFFR